MVNDKKPAQKNFLRYITRIDVFGAPIRLTHKGQETFRTLYGAVATAVLGFYLTYFAINAFIPVVTSDIASFSSTPKFLSLED
jgi:hypothetical protein